MSQFITQNNAQRSGRIAPAGRLSGGLSSSSFGSGLEGRGLGSLIKQLNAVLSELQRSTD